MTKTDSTIVENNSSATSRRRSECRKTLDQLRQELLDQRHESGHWTGELAASALSTATAISAMSTVLLKARPADQPAPERQSDHEIGDLGMSLESSPDCSLRLMIRSGMRYLDSQQNSDGGFGDTDRSHSNIATSYLVLAASVLAGRVGEQTLDDARVSRLNAYLDAAGRLDGLRARYGKDKTFVVPIMNNLAIAGLISWDDVPALPFEAAVFPQSMYRFLQMPVVSYAIPALVAIGQARHFLGRRSLFPLRLIRSLCVGRTLDVLQRMQPASGGYLEATPLTAFVVMSLAATGRCDLPVVTRGLAFLKQSMSAEGSWPIDTNLATWATSLSIHALACDPDDHGQWYRDELLDWHLGCQHLQRHPFTGAEPGGWGWTDLTGAVPDSDDTPAAILALDLMRRYAPAGKQVQIRDAMTRGARWLLRLQNRNGGWPTFCRGWGKLPFDRSSTDLTAHAMRALRVVAGTEKIGDARATGDNDSLPRPQKPPNNRSANREVNSAEFVRPMQQAVTFLKRMQHDDGRWDPLWFGNQDRPDETNPVYGTAKVLIAAGTNGKSEAAARDYLLNSQNPDGGWGGGPSVPEKIRHLVQSRTEFSAIAPQIPAGLSSSVEETALAVEALTTLLLRKRDKKSSDCGQSAAERPNARSVAGEKGLTNGAPNCIATGNDPLMAAILSGVDFLTQSVQDRRHQVAWPIGFYFAKLWYHERLYPLIFTAAALGKFLRATDEEHNPNWPR
ncbi:MAG: squalene--hopene cyclase [Planctomycetales bacterium]|nr:squalene--hopene cyclase [Planctomycetales bacterium]